MIRERQPRILVLDGIRGVALLGVLLFHFSLPGFKNGFIWLDVFFVLSGFLITQLIQTSDRGKSYFDFLCRRFWRLGPGLLVTVGATLALGTVIMAPSHLRDLGESATLTIFPVINFWLIDEGGYFARKAVFQPFLHIWSLAVEEQFCIVWAFFLILLRPSRKWLIFGTGFLFFSSLIFSEFLMSINESAAYFLLPSRFFAFMAGAFLYLIDGQRIKNPALNDLMFLSGVSLILFGMHFVDASYPGLDGLYAVLGTFFCIWGRDGKRVKRILEIRPLVHLGRISYSVYLVHWPMIIFYSYLIPYRALTIIETISLFAGSLIVGKGLSVFADYRFQNLYLNRKIGLKHMLGAGAAAVVLLVYCEILIVSNGMPQRIDSAHSELDRKQIEVSNGLLGAHTYGEKIVVGDPEGKLVAIFIGDSFAGQYASKMNQLLKEHQQKILFIAKENCFFTFNPTSGKQIETCEKTIALAKEALKENRVPLIWAQLWTDYATLIRLPDQEDMSSSLDPSFGSSMIGRIEAMRSFLGNRPLILIGNVPGSIGIENLTSCLRRPQFLKLGCEAKLGLERKPGQREKLNIQISTWSRDQDCVFFINPFEALCRPDSCAPIEDGKFLYADDFHLSEEGARQVLASYQSELQRAFAMGSTGSCPSF